VITKRVWILHEGREDSQHPQGAPRGRALADETEKDMTLRREATNRIATLIICAVVAVLTGLHVTGDYEGANTLATWTLTCRSGDATRVDTTFVGWVDTEGGVVRWAVSDRDGGQNSSWQIETGSCSVLQQQTGEPMLSHHEKAPWMHSVSIP